MKICTVITIALLHFLKTVDSHPQSQYRRQSMHHWVVTNFLQTLKLRIISLYFYCSFPSTHSRLFFSKILVFICNLFNENAFLHSSYF